MRRRKRYRETPTGPREAAKRVLEAAAHTPYYLDMCEADRLIWMLEQAYLLGTRAEGVAASSGALRQNVSPS